MAKKSERHEATNPPLKIREQTLCYVRCVFLPQGETAMTSRIALAALITLTACAQRGPEGPAGPVWGGGPSISAVNPAFVAAGTSQTVLLSVFGTDWTDESTVSMGTGISGEKVTCASPTCLVVELTVA